MNINIGQYYEAKLAHLVAMGVASNKTEALRMAVTAFERQLDEEEVDHVLERISSDEAGWAKSGAKFKTLDEVLKGHGLSKPK